MEPLWYAIGFIAAIQVVMFYLLIRLYVSLYGVNSEGGKLHEWDRVFRHQRNNFNSVLNGIYAWMRDIGRQVNAAPFRELFIEDPDNGKQK